MKKLWILNRAFHQDIADNLLAVFNEKTERLQEVEKLALFSGSAHHAEMYLELKLTLASIQDACVWHINEAHKYSALIACEGVEGLLEQVNTFGGGRFVVAKVQRIRQGIRRTKKN
jgi:hypothetical protein